MTKIDRFQTARRRSHCYKQDGKQLQPLTGSIPYRETENVGTFVPEAGIFNVSPSCVGDMVPAPLDRENVRLIGYHDLENRPGFKIALQVVDGRWLLYLAHFWHRGWSILDVTDPTDPTYESFIPGPDNTFTKQIQVADGKMITGLERPSKTDPVIGEPTDPSEPYETGAYIWDVESDPTDPELLGHYETGGRGTHRNFYTGGDYVFMCASPEGYEPTMSDPETKPMKNYHLRIVDISTPSEPVEVSTWMYPGQDPDETDEKLYNRYFHGPAYVTGDRAYLSYGRVGMVLLDVSDVHNPELIYKLGLSKGTGSFNGVHSFIPIPGKDLAVANSESVHEGSPLDHDNGDPLGYTYIVDTSEECQPDWRKARLHGPRMISSIPIPTPSDHEPYSNYYEKNGRAGPHNQHHPRGEESRYQTDGYLFMTYFNAGLRVFDISDPVAPKPAGHWLPEDPPERIGGNRPGNLGTQLEDVVVDSRGYVYCTDPQRGLMILETDLL